jgi:hypothetical protein
MDGAREDEAATAPVPNRPECSVDIAKEARSVQHRTGRHQEVRRVVHAVGSHRGSPVRRKKSQVQQVPDKDRCRTTA